MCIYSSYNGNSIIQTSVQQFNHNSAQTNKFVAFMYRITLIEHSLVNKIL